MKISIVIPAFNEETVVGVCIPQFQKVLAGGISDFEVICVDDGSTDKTWAELSALTKRFKNLTIVRLSRNFGHDAALFAGFEFATGDAIATMDCDGQHPPEVVLQMVERMQATGCDVVNAVKTSRQGYGTFHRLFVAIFGRILSSSLRTDLLNATEFKLIRRHVVDVLRGMQDFHFFYRALVPWVGFRQESLPFDPLVRSEGTSHWSLFGLIRFAISGLVLFSNLPLKAIAAAGAVIIPVCSFVALAAAFGLFSPNTEARNGMVLALLTLNLAIGLFGVALLGVYVFATLQQAIRRPRAIVAEVMTDGSARTIGKIL